MHDVACIHLDPITCKHRFKIYFDYNLSLSLPLAGGMFRGMDCWSAHRLHLQCFMSGMSGSIRNVTHLGITLPPSVGSSKERQGISELLSKLGSACPALHQLMVSGDIDRSLLAASGAYCNHLTSLKVMDSVPGDALMGLHLILPQLSHCTLVPASPIYTNTDDENDFAVASPCTLSLLSCTMLTDLDVGPCTLTPEMWHALPPGLRKLQCSFVDEEPSHLTLLTNLESLTCYCPHNNIDGPSLRNLVAILHVSPNLRTVSFVSGELESSGNRLLWMAGRCVPSTKLNLIYLNERVETGLKIIAIPCKGAEHRGVNVWLWAGLHANPELNEPQDASIAEFLAQLPPLPMITGLKTSSDYDHPSDASITGYLADVFTNLDTLDLSFAINSTSLRNLIRCSALQHLILGEAQVCLVSLTLLCSQLVALKSLSLSSCHGVDAAEGVLLQQQLLV